MEYVFPGNAAEAVALLQSGTASVCAGGTDLFLGIRCGRATPRMLVDISRAGLNYIRTDGQGVRIGAMATLTEILESGALSAPPYCVLQQALAQIGAWQTRNAATLAGALCVGKRGADAAVAASVLGAEFILLDSRGERRVSAAEFLRGPIWQTQPRDALLSEVLLPGADLSACRGYYRKVGMRKANTLPEVCVAALFSGGEVLETCRIALCTGEDVPYRPTALEAWLRGKKPDAATAAEAAERLTWQPADGLHSGSAYRLLAAKSLLRAAITGGGDA